jgi:hypothetical protein
MLSPTLLRVWPIPRPKSDIQLLLGGTLLNGYVLKTFWEFVNLAFQTSVTDRVNHGLKISKKSDFYTATSPHNLTFALKICKMNHKKKIARHWPKNRWHADIKGRLLNDIIVKTHVTFCTVEVHLNFSTWQDPLWTTRYVGSYIYSTIILTKQKETTPLHISVPSHRASVLGPSRSAQGKEIC